MGRKKIDCFYWLNEHYNQFLRFIDLLLHKSSMVIRYFFYWSFFHSYFIDHTTHKTTWEDSKLKRPEAIPLTQFKVKLTIIWNSVWLMVIGFSLNRKCLSELGKNNQQLMRAHCTDWCWLNEVKCNLVSNHLSDFRIIHKISNHQQIFISNEPTMFS